MNTYQCTLIQTVRNKKLIKENFFREGKDEQEVREGLEMFEWPEGKWEIELA